MEDVNLWSRYGYSCNVPLGRCGRWYLEDEKLFKMTGEIGLECREINMILKLNQNVSNRKVHCHEKS